MGLFSKKTYNCAICGKAVESRIALADFACDECEAKYHIQGYKDYHDALGGWGGMPIPANEYPQVAAKRDAIFEKYRISNPLTDDEMANAAVNYKTLPQEQIKDIIIRMVNSRIESTLGASTALNFFALTKYDDVYVDADDVFAVAFTSDYKLDQASKEAILCAVFTNNPYVPVFPIVYEGKKGLFEVFKSKKGRDAVAGFFMSMCPNLKYPVTDIKELRKTIKAADHVEGNMDKDFMLHEISEMSTSSGIFNTKKLEYDLPTRTVKTLLDHGYRRDEEFTDRLHMNGMFTAKFWNKAIENAAGGI